MWEKYKYYWFILFACLVFFVLPGGADAKIDPDRFYRPDAAVFIQFTLCGVVRVIEVQNRELTSYRLIDNKDFAEVGKRKEEFREFHPHSESYTLEITCQ